LWGQEEKSLESEYFKQSSALLVGPLHKSGPAGFKRVNVQEDLRDRLCKFSQDHLA